MYTLMLAQVATIAATIAQAGGAELFNAKLALLSDTAGYVGGAEELAGLLTGAGPKCLRSGMGV